MGRNAVAIVCLVAAAIGGALALAVAKGTGWLSHQTTTVVVDRLSDQSTAAPVVSLGPLSGNGFDPARIYRQRAAGVVTVISTFSSTSGGQGSGFVVSPTGTILTNAHVVTTAGQVAPGATVRRAEQVFVEFSDGDRVPAAIVGYDLYDDVAVIKVDPRAHALSPVPLGDSSTVVVGEPVAAIGSPFGNVDSLSVGVVSATRRFIPSLTSSFDLVDAIQTDASINHGNSGGPLLDAGGEVIGINAQIKTIASSSGSDGVGFAVPIDSARRSLQELLQAGHVAYAYLGVSTEDLTPSIAKKYGYAAPDGALVDGVTPGGPAARAGIEAGDRISVLDGQDVRTGGDAIVAIDGVPVTGSEDVVRIVAERLVPGERATVTLVRGQKRRVVHVLLSAR